MPALQFAAQLYTLRQHTQTPADLADILRRVKQIGYPAVQISAIGKIDSATVAHLLQDEGLDCCATHVPLDRLKQQFAAVIEEHMLWNCRHTALGYFAPQQPSADAWLTFAADFSALAQRYLAAGIMLGYHNHSHEFVHYDGRPALDILVQRMDPAVWFELDTYWIAHAGADPAAWIDRVAGRIPCVHLKDMIIRPDGTQAMAEVGQGNLNWPDILAACQRAGVQWYIVEQDECDGDPFDSLAQSLHNLQQMTSK
jgi:sugar phosphate isomerase/epimerase